MQELDISHTILAKSDQLNADDLIGNEMVLLVTGVKLAGSDDQPLSINYEGADGRPYKPCKSMRKVLAGLWGKDANQWIGKSISVYNDPSVKWAGKETGGIRIKGLSHIDKNKTITLNESKHKKTSYKSCFFLRGARGNRTPDLPDASGLRILRFISSKKPTNSSELFSCGARGNRTPDLRVMNPAL